MYLGEQLPNPSDARLPSCARQRGGVEAVSRFVAQQIPYKEIGYTGIICPNHVPTSAVDPDKERQFAFCLGYIKALLQVVEAEA